METTIIVALSYGFIPVRRTLPQISVAVLGKAAELFKKEDEYGKATIFLSSFCSPLSVIEIKARRRILEKLGVPYEETVQVFPAGSTADEAKNVKDLIQVTGMKVRKIILVAQKDHADRAMITFQKRIPDIKIEFCTVEASFDPDNPRLYLRSRLVFRIANLIGYWMNKLPILDRLVDKIGAPTSWSQFKI